MQHGQRETQSSFCPDRCVRGPLVGMDARVRTVRGINSSSASLLDFNRLRASSRQLALLAVAIKAPATEHSGVLGRRASALGRPGTAE